MKRAILICLLCAGMLQGQTQIVRDRANAVFSNLFTRISTTESNYFSSNGKYRQARMSHFTIPADGAETVPNGYTNDYPALVTLTNLPFAVQIDEYTGPQGAGWALQAWVYYNSNLWTKCQESGPEGDRNKDWTKNKFNALGNF